MIQMIRMSNMGTLVKIAQRRRLMVGVVPNNALTQLLSRLADQHPQGLGMYGRGKKYGSTCSFLY